MTKLYRFVLITYKYNNSIIRLYFQSLESNYIWNLCDIFNTTNNINQIHEIYIILLSLDNLNTIILSLIIYDSWIMCKIWITYTNNNYIKVIFISHEL